MAPLPIPLFVVAHLHVVICGWSLPLPPTHWSAGRTFGLSSTFTALFMSNHKDACSRDDASCGWTHEIDVLFQQLRDQEVEGLDSLVVRNRISSSDHGCSSRRLRGLYTTAEWNAGEYICALPFSAALLVQDTTTFAEENMEKEGEADEEEENSSESLIREEIEQALFFLQHVMAKNTPYVNCLPKIGDALDEITTPDFWSLSDLDQIPVPRLRESTRLRKHLVQQMANGPAILLPTLAHPLDDCDNDNMVSLLQWATWLIRTRGFTTFRMVGGPPLSTTLTQRQVRKRCYLLPLIDFVNHENPSKACVALEVLETPPDNDDDDASMFALRAIRDIAPGEELTMTYGTGFETSLDLLDKYGFWQSNQQDGNDEDIPTHNNNNDRLDWALVECAWKESVSTAQAGNVLCEKKMSTAQQFNRHLAALYRKTVQYER